MDVARLGVVLAEAGEPRYREAQVLRAVFKEGASSYAEISCLPSALRARLASSVPILSLASRRVLVSSDGSARKALFSLRDGERIESVLLKPRPGGEWCACVSCQAGCAIGCAICATGRLGLRRSLAAEEISDQALFWRQHLAAERLGGRLSRVVYMGMGEPFHCWEAVRESLRALLDPDRFGLAARHVSVSTSGIVPGIQRFIQEFPQVNLAVSLHAASNAKRDALVPINRAYPLDALAQALREAVERTRRKVFLEYALIEGLNDGPADARDLAGFVGLCGGRGLIHVNLIPLNPAGGPYQPSPPAVLRSFRDLLRRMRVSVTIRKSLGADIRGACGQLAGEK
ncbi:MAG: 23S rRNA (adenine(2503)-C(2))-methyltransferase RlmN [Elusimicrobiota bacterium]